MSSSRQRHSPTNAPVEIALAANWSRRPYFRRAIEHPGQAHISRPSLSLANAKSCVTLSIQLRSPDGQLLVLCWDVAEA